MNRRVKCICAASIIIRGVGVIPLAAAAQAQESSSSGSISLNQDVFFGFYPQVNGSYRQNHTLDWTYYGIFWTTPSFGTGGGGGLWTEFGGGVNLKAWEGKLQFNPQLGVLTGKLLSNGSFPMALEGVVPDFTVNADAARVEGQFYLGYYLAARKGRAPAADGGALVTVPVQNNFVHWWSNGGWKVSSLISVGVHYEALFSNPSGTNPPASGHVYRWLGPYVQASLPARVTVRFTAGADVTNRPASNGTDSFYKLTATYRF